MVALRSAIFEEPFVPVVLGHLPELRVAVEQVLERVFARLDQGVSRGPKVSDPGVAGAEEMADSEGELSALVVLQRVLQIGDRVFVAFEAVVLLGPLVAGPVVLGIALERY